MAFETSVVSYPERGPWGDRAWAGNTSGHLVKDFLESYWQRGYVYDPMEGSGTTRDVCKELNIPYIGTDIHTGHDLMSIKTRRDIEAANRDKDITIIFWHPPYWNIVPYTVNQTDLSRAPTYRAFLSAAFDVMRWLSTSILAPGGVMGVLLADVRTLRDRRTYFLTDDLLSEENVTRCGLIKEFRYIKVQHNTRSGGRTSYQFAKLNHEYFTVLRKPHK